MGVGKRALDLCSNSGHDLCSSSGGVCRACSCRNLRRTNTDLRCCTRCDLRRASGYVLRISMVAQRLMPRLPAVRCAFVWRMLVLTSCVVSNALVGVAKSAVLVNDEETIRACVCVCVCVCVLSA